MTKQEYLALLMAPTKTIDSESRQLLIRLHEKNPHLRNLDIYHFSPISRCFDSKALSHDIQERLWYWRFARNSSQLWWKIATCVGIAVSLKSFVIYKRVAWYMEHSFDLFYPDVEFLTGRFGWTIHSILYLISLLAWGAFIPQDTIP